VVFVGAADATSFNVTCGAASASGFVNIKYTPAVGAGAFTVDALPVAILYEPPQSAHACSGRPNNASFQLTTSFSTESKLSFTTDNSTTTPGNPTMTSIPDLGMFASGLGGILGAVSDDPYTQGASKVLGFIGSGWGGIFGTDSVSNTTGSTMSSDHGTVITTSTVRTLSTDTHVGSPDGDRIVYLRDVKIAWVASVDKYKSDIRLGLMGWTYGPDDTPVHDLKQDLATIGASTALGAHSHLKGTVIQQLLNLDPFYTGGATANLPQDRFVPNPSAPSLSNNTDPTPPNSNSVSFQSSTTTEAGTGITTYTESTEDAKSGFLSFLGVGPSTTQALKTRLTNSGYQTTISTNATTSTATLCATQDDGELDVYVDKTFATLALQPPKPGAMLVTGTVRNGIGMPLANQRVDLVLNGVRFTTRSDAQGNYRFHSSFMQPGAAIVSAGATTKSLVLTIAGARNLDIGGPVKTL
jgi:hypothetical protein